MAESIFSGIMGILIIGGMFVTFFIVIIYALISKRGNPFKDFKPSDSTATQYNDLKKHLKTCGVRTRRGKLIMGTHKLGDIYKLVRVKGKFIDYQYNENTKNFEAVDESEGKKFDIVIFMCHNPFLLFRLIGIKRVFFMLEHESLINFDAQSMTYSIKDHTDLKRMGGIWINSASGAEYLYDLSIKHMNIELMSALESYPNKVVHLEMQQAKKERLYREIMETDKAKYDAIKKAEDTAIS